jgi:succinate dehydrogenase / fumarate reductase cytochrome b subunit
MASVPAPPVATARPLGFYATSVGKKILMAVSGIILFGFITVHMIGNLQIYIGPERLNAYSRFLHENSLEILWPARIVLLLSVLVHIVAAAQVWWKDRTARPVGYRVKVSIATNYAARTMVWSGPIIFFFVIYHLLHLTFGTAAPGEFLEEDVYRNVVTGFQHWPVALAYIVANLALAFHLYHGLWSLFQTLGWEHPRFNACRRWFATIFAAAIAVGNISIPVSVLAGWIR